MTTTSSCEKMSIPYLTTPTPSDISINISAKLSTNYLINIKAYDAAQKIVHFQKVVFGWNMLEDIKVPGTTQKLKANITEISLKEEDIEFTTYKRTWLTTIPEQIGFENSQSGSYFVIRDYQVWNESNAWLQV
jgi:hypothetical protein